ncbi:pyrophosphatase PpaX [Virgibacillus phasianinus]|uniref:Pyrophosphatase PpaX n=1 Tax=Virgibacillus phasianinus TaxID=2017483 RepID=A0A220U4I5_9BACI|nr:pyrophosphatase PpaX [Virgibacillus phasianinus]ASK62741.1 pyrophosphatase PpaX [Virgibacillus phasianinus]
MKIHTILFDLDGTLIDTNELIITSFLHTFEHFKIPITREETLPFIGPTLKDTFDAVDPAKSAEMIQVYREHNLHHHDNYVEAYPYVVETLRQLKENDVRLGIVTTKMHEGATRGLKLVGLEELFDTVITLDDVTHAKPHPEPIIKAMNELGSDASSTLMVGDNTHDIEAGQNAGVKTAGVAWSIKGKETLQSLNPTYILEDMRDLFSIAEV